ncbi:hypothetical protein [Thalassotalea sp. G2M2-11]|uniref:hypothetical protein n=1 Tax=Thalassotalea sp. G2M2-11 TaxID=2787627 RepID=UPI0019CFC28E|nr:hypothetical protein [Thalassotalea sp. G2M2-11]
MSQAAKFQRNKDEQSRCVEIHDKFRDDLLKRQLSNSEGYDKAILSLSSAGLALSLTAIKFIIPLDTAHYLWAIKTSWWLFFTTIICSLLAYLIGNIAIGKQLKIAEKYYLEGLVSAQTEKNIYTTINSFLNNITGIIFAVAISLVIYFVTANLNGDQHVKDKNLTNTNISKTVTFRDSAPIPNMQIAPGGESRAKLSADLPSMQMAPGTVAPVSESAAPTESSGSSTKENESK